MKNKSRILLPDSCCLIGVVDQDGLLEENQIFVQIRRDNTLQPIQDKKSKDGNKLIGQLEQELSRINQLINQK